MDKNLIYTGTDLMGRSFKKKSTYAKLVDKVL